MRAIILSLLCAAALSGVQIVYDNTLTPDVNLAVTPFGPNSGEPIGGLVVDLLGDQITLDPNPTGWLNGYQATTSVYNLGDEFQGVLRLSLYNVAGVTLGALIGTFDSVALALPTSGLTGTLVTWDLGNVPLSTEMVWLIGVQADNSLLGNLPLLSLENYVMPQGVGSSSDAHHWWQLNSQPIVVASSGFVNDSFYFHVTAVPEPSTIALTALGLSAALLRHRLRRR